MKSFKLDLDEPIEYAVKGEIAEGKSITFYAPKPNQRNKIAKVKQIFFQAIPKEGSSSNADVKADDVSLSGNEVNFIIASSTADYAEYIDLVRSIICDRCAKIDDVEYITTAIIDKFSYDVLELMIGEYVANFIVRSALMSLQKT